MSSVLQSRSPQQVNFDRSFRAAAHVVSTRHAETTVLLDLHQGLYYSLNELGWRIWEQVGVGVPIAQVVRLLRQAYDVPPDTFTGDVMAFVDHLLRAGLIEQVEC